MRHRAALRTVYLDPALVVAPPAGDCRVFQVAPLARHMLLEAMRWGPGHNPEDGVAVAFFAALGALAGGWMAQPLDLRLPRPDDPSLARAVALTLDRLGDPDLTAPAVARAAGMSPRTMSRRFARCCGLSWRAFVHRARMVRAVDLLADPARSVTEVCFAVGYRSLGTFSAAFTRLVGASPRAVQQGLQGGAAAERLAATLGGD